jgi:hypothetical protein
MMTDEKTDINLECANCGSEFTYSKVEREFDQERGIEAQTLCQRCRQEDVLDKSELKGEGESGANGGFNS